MWFLICICCDILALEVIVYNKNFNNINIDDDDADEILEDDDDDDDFEIENGGQRKTPNYAFEVSLIFFIS